MANWQTYKGNIDVPDVPTGDAGIKLRTNFMNLRDGLTLVSTSKTANYEAQPNDLVVCNATSSSFTITLPPNPLVDTRVGVKLASTTSFRTVTVDVLDASSGGHIIGNGDEGGAVVLYIAGDYLELSYTGSDTWQVVSDTRQPHITEIYKNGAQSFNDNTQARCELDTVAFESAGMADTTSNNYKINIKRAGKYQIVGNSSFSSLTSAYDVELRLVLNGSSVRRSTMRLADDQVLDDIYWQIESILNLSVNDNVALFAFYKGASAMRSTANNDMGRPRLTVAEIR